MKVMTILGTRPEIIRLSVVIELLDCGVEHTLVHTGQNFDKRLSDVFFTELGVRAPDVHLGIDAEGFGAQVGALMAQLEPLLRERRPDRLLVLGDTNSGLSAVVARRLGIPVYHMEAGNRCYDDRVPEEVNRRIIDHSSTVLMPYTERSRANLLREGFSSERVFVTGNPIKQVMDRHAATIAARPVLTELGLVPGRYFLVTMHRAENVDRGDRLRGLVAALAHLADTYGHPVICSLHPRTRSQAHRHGVSLDHPRLRFLQPLGFWDFVRLEQSAFCVLTDSGTVQEEACILGIPNVTIRDVTERPETIESGSNALAGANADDITRMVRLVTTQKGRWNPPPEYLAPAVAETVTRIVTGYRVPDSAELEWTAGLRV